VCSVARAELLNALHVACVLTSRPTGANRGHCKGKHGNLEGNAVKTKHMLVSRHQNAGQSHDIQAIYRGLLKTCHGSDICGRQ
jgi:hypothetical protein